MLFNRKTRIRDIGLFFAIFLTIFWLIYRSNDSDLQKRQRFIRSVKISVIVSIAILGMPSSAYPKKDSNFLPGAEGFTPPLSRPAPSNNRHFGSKPTIGMGGSNPGSGGGSSNPGSGGEGGSCPAISTSKSTPGVVYDTLTQGHKTKKQKA